MTCLRCFLHSKHRLPGQMRFGERRPAFGVQYRFSGIDLIKHPRTTEKTVAIVSEQDIVDLLALVDPANYPSEKYQFETSRRLGEEL